MSEIKLPEKNWRRMAGNMLMYDTMGASQFSLLTLFFGLREKHKLLEIGSGPLRAGRFLVMYLNEGNYFGIEPDTNATNLGLKHEVGESLVDMRKPTIVDRLDYGSHELGQVFDYCVSYSVITHAPPHDVTRMFQNISKCFHDDSIFLGTAAIARGEEEIVDHENWTILPVNRYSFERLENEAAAIGMKAARIGRVFQDWFCVYKEGNEIAEKGIEQASKVNWNALCPKWEKPPLWGESMKNKKAA